MKKLLVPVALAVLLFTQPFTSIQASPQAQDDPVLAKVIDIGKNDNQTTKWLDILSNRFGPRISGTDALQQRRAVGRAAVQELGPAGRTAGGGRSARRILARRVVREDRRHAGQVLVLRDARVLGRHQGTRSRPGRRPAGRDGRRRGDEGEDQGGVGPGQRARRPQPQPGARRAGAHLQDARRGRRARRDLQGRQDAVAAVEPPRRVVGPAAHDAGDHAARHPVPTRSRRPRTPGRRSSSSSRSATSSRWGR